MQSKRVILKPKKTKTQDDELWTKKSEQLGGSARVFKGSAHRMRADNSTMVVNDEGKEVPLKTAATPHFTPTKMPSNVDRKKLEEAFEQKNKDIPTHRPIGRVVEKSKEGSPMAIETPDGKTKLSRVGGKRKYPVRLFSNKSVKKSPSPQKTVNDKFKGSLPATYIKENKLAIKHFKLHITSKLLKKIHKENRESPQRNQNKLMVRDQIPAKKGSAKQYAQAAGVAKENDRWEWLHIIAHQILGKAAQDSENLGAGSFHANTDMAAAEFVLIKLAETFKEGIHLEAKAYFIPNTHIMISIEYIVDAGKFKLPFVFNAQKSNAPGAYEEVYLRNFVDVVTKEIKNLDAVMKADLKYLEESGASVMRKELFPMEVEKKEERPASQALDEAAIATTKRQKTDASAPFFAPIKPDLMASMDDQSTLEEEKPTKAGPDSPNR